MGTSVNIDALPFRLFLLAFPKHFYRPADMRNSDGPADDECNVQRFEKFSLADAFLYAAEDVVSDAVVAT